jgi:hypothetical protein
MIAWFFTPSGHWLHHFALVPAADDLCEHAAIITAYGAAHDREGVSKLLTLLIICCCFSR